jgi:misacylated tRNA(Ala) deacylase
MSDKFFYQDAYAKSCKARVVQVNEYGIQLDRTVFYPVGGGQPGDTGVLRSATSEVEVTNTILEKSSGNCFHVLKCGSPLLKKGDEVTAELDWNKRYAHMRMHSALHLLCAVIDGEVTGGSIGKEKSRLDFNLPNIKLDKLKVTDELNRLIVEDSQISVSWITKHELDANIDLVRTMSVRPPIDSGRIRLIDIKGVDLQACGGTHVKSTGEIGNIRIGKIESKGKSNRRINLHFTS